MAITVGHALAEALPFNSSNWKTALWVKAQSYTERKMQGTSQSCLLCVVFNGLGWGERTCTPGILAGS